MKPAVRVVNAFPRVLNKAAVPAFEIAARLDGTIVPSKPVGTNPVTASGTCEGPGPPPRNRVLALAPVILKTPSALPSLSVTATVTGRFKDAAADTAWAIIVCTSALLRVPAVADGAIGGAGVPGVGTAPSSSGGPPPTWPMPTRTRLLLLPL